MMMMMMMMMINFSWRCDHFKDMRRLVEKCHVSQCWSL